VAQASHDSYHHVVVTPQGMCIYIPVYICTYAVYALCHIYVHIYGHVRVYVWWYMDIYNIIYIYIYTCVVCVGGCIYRYICMCVEGVYVRVFL